jgi:hypothetical protein
LENSGWAQFFLYQTLYCVDVEKPACEEAAPSSAALGFRNNPQHDSGCTMLLEHDRKSIELSGGFHK